MKGTAEELAKAIFASERRSRARRFARKFEEKLADLVALQKMANAVLRAAGRAERSVWPRPHGAEDGGVPSPERS